MTQVLDTHSLAATGISHWRKTLAKLRLLSLSFALLFHLA